MTLALIFSTFLTSAQVEQQYYCAARIAYHEARGEDTYRQRSAPVVVAANRVLHDEFRDTLCSVMTSPNQFTFVSDGLHMTTPSEYEAWQHSKEIANDVLNREIKDGNVGMGGSLFFQKATLPNWNPDRLSEYDTLGNHIYFLLD